MVATERWYEGASMDYYDLGAWTRKVTTSSPQAQVWFDRGLNWLYGFNHAEAIKCFGKAAEIDPDCAMAHWGIAYAAGPNYNLTWEDFGWKGAQKVAAICHAVIQQALAHLAGVTPVERALIEALARRYPADHFTDEAQFGQWNDAYAAAMRTVYHAFPNDLDVATLAADALLNRTPWQLWDLVTGEAAAGAEHPEAFTEVDDGIADVFEHLAGEHEVRRSRIDRDATVLVDLEIGGATRGDQLLEREEGLCAGHLGVGEHEGRQRGVRRRGVREPLDPVELSRRSRPDDGADREIGGRMQGGDLRHEAARHGGRMRTGDPDGPSGCETVDDR